jgi:cobalt-zinc-cadmium efflux system outer membrane protein
LLPITLTLLRRRAAATFAPTTVVILALAGVGGRAVGAPADAALPACPAVTAVEAAGAPAASLRTLFDAAWLRQPEAQAQPAWRDADAAARRAAGAWLAGPPALELRGQAELPGSTVAQRELELGLALPLWRPGERQRSLASLDAELLAQRSRAELARWRLAGELRLAWWAWQGAALDLGLAHQQLEQMCRLAADVARRVAAGDLARADQHQAEAEVAAAQAALAQAEMALAQAATPLQADALCVCALCAGAQVDQPCAVAQADAQAAELPAEPLPALPDDPAASLVVAPSHPALLAAQHELDALRRQAELQPQRSGERPALSLSTLRGRAVNGEPPPRAIGLALRWPLGQGGDPGRAELAGLHAKVREAEADAARQQARLTAELQGARLRLAASERQLAAATTRARLVDETLGFFDKSFRLGNTDLPTRLRLGRDAQDAQRDAARARLARAAAISALRQALGLLPE